MNRPNFESKNTPDNQVVDNSNLLTAEKGGKFPDETEYNSQIVKLHEEIDAKSENIASITKEEITEILNKHPEKVANIMPQLKTVWRVGMIVAEAALAAFAASRSEWTPTEELKPTPESLIGFFAALVIAGKVVWDLIPSDKKATTPLKKANA